MHFAAENLSKVNACDKSELVSAFLIHHKVFCVVAVVVKDVDAKFAVFGEIFFAIQISRKRSNRLSVSVISRLVAEHHVAVLRIDTKHREVYVKNFGFARRVVNLDAKEGRAFALSDRHSDVRNHIRKVFKHIRNGFFARNFGDNHSDKFRRNRSGNHIENKVDIETCLITVCAANYSVCLSCFVAFKKVCNDNFDCVRSEIDLEETTVRKEERKVNVYNAVEIVKSDKLFVTAAVVLCRPDVDCKVEVVKFNHIGNLSAVKQAHRINIDVEIESNRISERIVELLTRFADCESRGKFAEYRVKNFAEFG